MTLDSCRISSKLHELASVHCPSVDLLANLPTHTSKGQKTMDPARTAFSHEHKLDDKGYTESDDSGESSPEPWPIEVDTDTGFAIWRIGVRIDRPIVAWNAGHGGWSEARCRSVQRGAWRNGQSMNKGKERC